MAFTFYNLTGSVTENKSDYYSPCQSNTLGDGSTYCRENRNGMGNYILPSRVGIFDRVVPGVVVQIAIYWDKPPNSAGFA